MRDAWETPSAVWCPCVTWSTSRSGGWRVTEENILPRRIRDPSQKAAKYSRILAPVRIVAVRAERDESAPSGSARHRRGRTENEAAEAELRSALNEALGRKLARGRPASSAAVHGVPTLDDFSLVLPAVIMTAVRQYLRYAPSYPPPLPAVGSGAAAVEPLYARSLEYGAVRCLKER